MSTEHTLRLIGEFLTQGGHAHGIDPDTLDREAVLVAAAPTLLAALQEVLCGLDTLREPYRNEAICERARAAIAKATGEETNA